MQDDVDEAEDVAVAAAAHKELAEPALEVEGEVVVH